MKKPDIGNVDFSGSLQDLVDKGEAFTRPYTEAMSTTVMAGVKNGAVVKIVRTIAESQCAELTDAQCRSKLARLEGMTEAILLVFCLDAFTPKSADVPATYTDDAEQPEPTGGHDADSA